MTSLALWSDGTCVTGFVFNFCANLEKCENRSVGIYNGIQTKFLNIRTYNFDVKEDYSYLTNVTSVKSYVDEVVYSLEICVDDIECIIAGSANNELNKNIYNSSMNLITAFWGSFSENKKGRRKCLKDFGIDFLNKK
jgi:hypothetical protein